MKPETIDQFIENLKRENPTTCENITKRDIQCAFGEEFFVITSVASEKSGELFDVAHISGAIFSAWPNNRRVAVDSAKWYWEAAKEERARHGLPIRSWKP